MPHKEKHLGSLWNAKDPPCLPFVARMKNRKVYAVGNNTRFHYGRSQNRFFNFLHQPPAGGGYIKTALTINLFFSLPIEASGVPRDRWVGREIRTFTTTRFPAFAVKGVGAMPAQKPGVMQR